MIKRIALIYDDSYKWTTAFYCKSALEKLGFIVDHFLPDDVDSIPSTYDLYLNIDENMRYLLPGHLRPSAYLVIDTHMDYDWRLKKAKMFNFVFACHKKHIERLKKDGVRNVYWLPLACDPDIHKNYHLPKEYDVAFVGHYNNSKDFRNRIKYLNFLRKELKNNKLFIGQAYGDDMAKIYSKSKIIFNISIKKYLNMRLFEAMSCGSLLITDDISKNGVIELFGHTPPFIIYRSRRDLLKKIKYYLCNDNRREEIAAKGYDEVVNKHTYVHRMEKLIKIVEKGKTRLKYDDYAEDITALMESLYSKVFNLISDSKRVLDIGCATGRFSKYLVSKKSCFVTGIEKEPLLAEKAKRVLSEVIVGDAADPETFSKITGKYDFILLMDILEHVVHPEFILSKAKNLLTENGEIFLTTPNIAYWAVRKDILLGKFNYDPNGGLMDNEHVHFFTYYSLKDMIRESGYSIKHFDVFYSFPLINENHPFFGIIAKKKFIKKVMYAIARKFPNFFAYQFLLCIVKNSNKK